MANPTRCGIMDILYVIDHDLAGKPLNAARNDALDSTIPSVQQPQDEVPFAMISRGPFTSSTTKSRLPSSAVVDEESSDYARSASTGLMSIPHSPLYPSIASSSEDGKDSSTEAVHTIPASDYKSKTKPKPHRGKEYWTKAEDSLLIDLVKKCSADGHKHWKVISGQMNRSLEACRTRWKILAKGLRTFSAEEEGELKGLLSELEPKLHEICAEKMRKSPEEIRDAIPFLGKPRPKEGREDSEATPRILKPKKTRRRQRLIIKTDDEDPSTDESPSPALEKKRHHKTRHHK